MKNKTYIFASLALVMGVMIGGVALNSVSADEEAAEGLRVPPMMEQYIDEEERVQLQANFEEHRVVMEERHELMEKATREATKTDDGIQINITWEDSEDVAKAHEMFDENDGEWGKWGGEGMKGMERGMHQGMFGGE